MKTMHKYEVPMTDQPFHVELPHDAQVRWVDFLVPTKKVFMWVEVDISRQGPKQRRTFHLYRSGDGIPVSYHYVGTAVDQYIPETYHLFEKVD